MIENIFAGNKLLAMIISHEFAEQGVHFVTPHNLSQQLAFIKHPSGKMIEPHVHNPLPREVLYTQEVLILQKGRLRIDFYDDDSSYLESRTLNGGDVVLLATGGHGFEVLEDIEMIEVKQGPYSGDNDKTRFITSPKGEYDSRK